METILCPRCRTENNYTNSFCKNCDYPLDMPFTVRQKSNTRLIIIIILIIILVTAISGLAYIEMKYPKYGLGNRIKLSWQVFTSDKWITISNEKLDQQIKDKKETLTQLEKQITKKKQEVIELQKVEARVDALLKKLEKAERLKKKKKEK